MLALFFFARGTDTPFVPMLGEGEGDLQTLKRFPLTSNETASCPAFCAKLFNVVDVPQQVPLLPAGRAVSQREYRSLPWGS